MNNIALNKGIETSILFNLTNEDEKRLAAIRRDMEKANFSLEDLNSLNQTTEKKQQKLSQSATKEQLMYWMVEYFQEAENLRFEKIELKQQLEQFRQRVSELENQAVETEQKIKKQTSLIEKLSGQLENLEA